MRFVGLTLCLLASSLGARAESVEDRVAALEARVKVLETALQTQAAKPVAPNAANIDGIYQATLPGGETISVEFKKGTVTAFTRAITKTGTYEIAGQRVMVITDDDSKVLTIDGDHLILKEGDNKIEFTRTK